MKNNPKKRDEKIRKGNRRSFAFLQGLWVVITAFMLGIARALKTQRVLKLEKTGFSQAFLNWKISSLSFENGKASKMKKAVFLISALLMSFALLICVVSASNLYNYVYNGSSWEPMLSTADGQQKLWIEMKNCSYGSVQNDLYVSDKVGIGTTSPSQKLEVVGGDVNISSGNLTIEGGLNIVNSTRSSDSWFYVDNVTGNVGIGTTSPDWSISSPDRVTEINYDGDGFPVLKLSRTSGSSKTDGNWSFTVSSLGALAIHEVDANVAPLQIEQGSPAGSFHINSAGNVGIGTASPDEAFEIKVSDPVFHLGDSDGASTLGAKILTNNSDNDLEFATESPADVFPVRMTIKRDTGNVGIGTTTPTSGKLQIANANTASNYGALYILNDETDNWGFVIAGDSTYGLYLDANADDQCHDGVGTETGPCDLNDYAEMMEFSELPEDSEVIVIDIENPGKLKVSTKPYDKLVAGIASEEPAMVIGSYGISIKGWDKNTTAKISSDGTEYYTYPLAISGRKRIKVTDENGEVMPGDFLVSSSTPGHAMKFTLRKASEASNFEELQNIIDENEQRRNSIIGKALTKAGDNKLVLALITLQ